MSWRPHSRKRYRLTGKTARVEAFVYADRDALQQILTYFLQNAAAITPPTGTITLDARISAGDDDGPYLIVEVTDQGGGIPMDEVGKVFDREYRSEHPSIPGIGDRGVGLAITRTLVEAHQGRIWVESNDTGYFHFQRIVACGERSNQRF